MSHPESTSNPYGLTDESMDKFSLMFENEDYISLMELYQKGLPVDLKERKTGMTALMFGVKTGFKPFVEILLKMGADINSQDKHDRTVLMMLTTGNLGESEVKSFLEILLPYQPDVTVKDRNTRTVIERLKAKKYFEAADIIQAYSENKVLEKTDCYRRASVTT